MKLLSILFLSLFIFISCSKSSDSSGSGVTGVDMSGTYNLKGVECYNASLSTLTSSATYNSGYTDVVTITGNSFTETSTTSNCVVSYSSNIVFKDANKMDMTSYKVSSATNNSCSQTSSFSSSSITPSSKTTVYTTGETFSDTKDAVYIYNSANKVVGILSTFSDGSGGYCFIIYQKQ